jgi:ADP-dependent glucokinase
LLFLAFSSILENVPHSKYYDELKGQPDLLKVIDILEWTLQTYGDVNDKRNSKLTRLHFHCLTFHIIAEVKDKGWSNTDISLLSGSKIAAIQACGFNYNDTIDDDEFSKLVELRFNSNNMIISEEEKFKFKIGKDTYIDFDPNNPVVTFERDNIKFYFTPVLVCRRPLKTVGLGDAISSNGILHAKYRNL